MSIQIKRQRNKLRAAVELELKSLEALLFCSFELTEKNVDWINDVRTNISTSSKEQLRGLLTHVQSKMHEARVRYGAKVQNNEYINQYDLITRSGMTGIVYIEKQWFERLFNKCERIFLDFRETPRHALYGLSLPPQPDDRRYREFVLPEITLFEDMAALFNEAFTLHQNNNQTIAKTIVKRQRAADRACVIAALGFVEAYINGVAYDFLLDRDKPSIAEKDIALLMERDEKSALNERFVSLRTKVLQYPRIVTGKKHPPLTESNCSELKTLFEIGKEIRDSVVHPTFLPRLKEGADGYSLTGLDKARRLVSLPFADVERVVDAAIIVVLRLENELGGRLQRFIKMRDTNGMFSDDVFS